MSIKGKPGPSYAGRVQLEKSLRGGRGVARWETEENKVNVKESKRQTLLRALRM